MISKLTPQNKGTEISSKLGSMFSTAKVPSYRDPRRLVPFYPDIKEVFSKSRDPDELEHYWTEWRKATGIPMKPMYDDVIDVQNRIARDAGFDSAVESSNRDYEMPDVEAYADEIFDRLRPLYEQLHAFVRRKLREKYGPSKVPESGPIPEHLLGDMHGRNWIDLEDIVSPFASSKDQLQSLEDEMNEQSFTPLRMFMLAEDFFKSLGLPGMTPEFWRNSIITRPTEPGREIECHGSAWDFHDGKDFRIKMCSTVSIKDLETVHHEMGHVEYYEAYKGQPALFQKGANPAFHEAIGDTISLSSMSMNHLNQLGLLRRRGSEEKGEWKNESFRRYVGGGSADLGEADLSYLFAKALATISFLPFGLLMDKWRWGVFRGEITPENYNREWWKLKLKYQGVTPPPSQIRRRMDDETLFDPGAKYHIPNSVGYIRYFFSFVLQFQFYESMCEASGHVGPLHRCDFYGSTEAGEKLRQTMALGASRPWREALEEMTGKKEISADAIVKYFEPLRRYLEVENLKSGQRIGWEH